jgi:Rrf2 family protein
MRITAKVDYAVRAATELARHHLDAGGRAPMKGEAIATRQAIPVRFLESILAELRRAGIVGSQRGAEGGYWLARPPEEVSVADLIRAVEGPLADVHGTPPEELEYAGAAAELQTVWIATRAALRSVLEATTLTDIVARELPAHLHDLADAPDAWSRR